MVAKWQISRLFSSSNPTPEIMPHEVTAVRSDAIIATGRSDYPNQVNNVLGFPYIFRGALDVRARDITQGMKMAATALAALAKEPVRITSLTLILAKKCSTGQNILFLSHSTDVY